MAQRIRIVPHDPVWTIQYEQERVLLAEALGPGLLEIHHIGSTAVPGLAAKPILDILPVVRSLVEVDTRRTALEALGYEYMGEFGIPGRRYLRKGGDNRTHQVHIFENGNTADILRHLAFRDYLRTHPAACAAYGALKQRLAKQYPDDIEGYCDGKNAFVKENERLALDWYARQQK